jgi:hypothetical protein
LATQLLTLTQVRNQRQCLVLLSTYIEISKVVSVTGEITTTVQGWRCPLGAGTRVLCCIFSDVGWAGTRPVVYCVHLLPHKLLHCYLLLYGSSISTVSEEDKHILAPSWSQFQIDVRT